MSLPDGTTYEQTRNPNGVILRSTQLLGGNRDVIYLGISCDVLSDRLGEGKWAFSPDAVIIDFIGESLSFRPAADFVGRDITACTF